MDWNVIFSRPGIASSTSGVLASSAFTSAAHAAVAVASPAWSPSIAAVAAAAIACPYTCHLFFRVVVVFNVVRIRRREQSVGVRAGGHLRGPLPHPWRPYSTCPRP